jgi:hypothetical protein
MALARLALNSCVLTVLALAVGVSGCSDETEISPTSADAPAPTAAEQSTIEETDSGDQDADDANGAGETFTRPVTILETQLLQRRPEDDLTIRIRHGALSIIYPVPNSGESEAIPDDADYLGQLRILAPLSADYGDAFLTVFDGLDESVFDVLNRWLEQIEDPQYTPQIRELEYMDGTLLVTTEFAAVGTYDPGVEGFEPVPDTMVLGAVVEGGHEGTLIMKLVGPRELVEDQRYRWDLIMRSLRTLEKPPEI